MQSSTVRRTKAGHAPTVLVVEDDPSVRAILERWVAESGRIAIACRTFEEAKACLAAEAPDVLVTDIRLQDYNGLQLVLELGDKRPAAACVVITGHDDPVLRKEAEQMQAHYLVKPVDRADFLAAIG